MKPINMTMETDDDDQSPGSEWSRVHKSMSELMDKLLCLDYSRSFRAQFKSPPIQRLHFIDKDFMTFLRLCLWLLKKNEFTDDYEAIVELINNELNDPSISLSDLRNNREIQIKVLNIFADREIQKLNSDKIEIKGDSNDDDDDIINEPMEEMEDNGFTLIDDTFEESEEKKEILVSKVDFNEWKRECERIAPQLKLKAEQRNDWRMHLRDFHNHRQSLDTDSCFSLLKRSINEARAAQQKVASREKFVASQTENVTSELGSLRHQLDKVREEYGRASVGVSEKSGRLALISEAADSIRSEMDTAGAAINDQSALSAAKSALMSVRLELTGMDIRMGVACVTLLKR